MPRGQLTRETGIEQDVAGRLYRLTLLPAFALLLLVTMWLLVIGRVQQESATAHNDAVVRSQSLARTLADHMLAVLRVSDHATQLFKLKFEQAGGAYRLATFAASDGLLDSAMPTKLEPPIAVLDAAGRVVDRIHGYPSGGLPLDTAFFKDHAASDSDLPLFGAPLIDASTKKWQIRVSRRLNDRQGGFAGVIVMLVDPGYFLQDYDSMPIDPQGLVMLLSRESGLSAGRSGDRIILSDRIDFAAAAGADSPADEVRVVHPFDPVPRIYSFRDLPRYGLTAVVGVTQRVAMKKFVHHRKLYYSALVLSTALIVVFVALLMQQSARLRRSMREAKEAQSMLRAAAHGSLDAVFFLKAWRPRGRGEIEDFVFADLNQQAAGMLGRPRAELLGKRVCATFPLMRQEVFFGQYLKVLSSGQPLEDEFLLPLPDAKSRWLRHQIVAIENGVAITTRDITTMREWQQDLLESEARLRTIADTLPAMVAYVDANQVYRFENMAYENEFGLSRRQVEGRTVREAVGERRYQTLEPYIRRVLAGETLRFEEDDEHQGLARCTEVNYIPQWDDEHRNVVGFHVMRQDITVQKREKQRLLKLAQVDALTGLANRAGFLQKLDDAMLQCRQSSALMAVMYMDLDRFKPVNDTYGHNVGDALLKAFSQRLAQTVRVSDTIGRMGGDEFTIIMEKIARREDASLLADKIVGAMQTPFELDGITVTVSVSIGLAFFRDAEIGPAELLKQADMLLYLAKQAGRNTFRSAASDHPA